ncbi:hypothetical protein [Enterococcus mundtii]|uniref:hypothetical protein n=1 Tax=Enterococcus mundtii TaxID=53346 RepID=UPI0013774944|nr:hypothetical protein [Enterococcus mundtii]NBA63798.1 hypothetical protein [Enterococcus mundtii]
MSFGKWKPIEPSIEGLAFKENQLVSFKHKKKQVVGTIVSLLNNSASIAQVSVTSEKTVINYKNLVAI